MTYQASAWPSLAKKRRSLLPLATLTLVWAIAGGAVLPRIAWSDLGAARPPDSLTALEVLLRSPSPPLDGVVLVAELLFAVVWAWIGVSVAIEAALGLLEVRSLRSAALALRLRGITDRLTFPLARRAVAAALLLQVVARPAGVTFASPAPATAIVTAAARQSTISVAPESNPTEASSTAPFSATHLVKRGDTLWSIAEHYYGAGDEFDRLVDGNVGRLMPDGRRFERAGLIYPGWTIEVPLAIEDRDGVHWYVVRRGDSLRGIATRLLGNEERYRDLFELNVGVARVGDVGPVLSDPDLIWPGLRLRLPDSSSDVTPEPVPPGREDEGSADAATVTGDRVQEAVSPAADRDSTATENPTPIASTQPISTAIPVEPTPEPTLIATPALPTSRVAPASDVRASPPIGALAGGAAVAALAVAGAFVVRRRRQAPPQLQPESDVSVRDGFAAADPVEGLARRLAQTVDPAAAVAGLLSRAYADVFAEELTGEQRREAIGGLEVVTTRHGRSSTTITIAAPVHARPHLIQHMQDAVARAFGEHTDVDGLVSRDGDVIVRVTWDPRHPVSAHLLDRLSAADEATAWPAPSLVPLMALYDRQTLSINWRSLSHILVAAPLGDGADTIASALVASLASGRAPEDLGFVIIAAPRTLADELQQLPHVLVDPADAASVDSVLAAVEVVQAELARRIAGTAQTDAEVVLVIRDLAELDATILDGIATIAARGHQFGIRILAVTTRPASELLARCAFLEDFGTRIVRATADEDESVALFGAPGAEELASGGHVLVRLEGRAPIQGWANRVTGDHLQRLLRLMGTRVSSSPDPVDVTSISAETDDAGFAEVEETPEDEPQVESSNDAATDTQVSVTAPNDTWSTPLIQQLRAAPLRVQCFGGRDVWYRDRLLWPNGEAEADRSWELLILLAVHRLSGVQSESLVDMLWGEETPRDTARALRQRRWRGREELRRLAPDLDGEPMPTDASRNTSQVYTLSPAVVRSDVHLFLELTQRAKSLTGTDAIQAYEEAIALYRGDLLDASDVPTYTWLYDGQGIALTLRSDYRRLHHDARLHLADLLAAGPASGLARAADLYIQLCAEDPDDERLWIALFRVHERADDVLGLDSSVRRLRAALCELSSGEADPDKVAIPPNLERTLAEIRGRLAGARVRSSVQRERG